MAHRFSQSSRLLEPAVRILDSCQTVDLGVEDDQSVEYGVRHCQEMSIILQRLINDGNVVFTESRSSANYSSLIC